MVLPHKGFSLVINKNINGTFKAMFLSFCLPTGLLRAGYYDLLIDIHLSSYATARLMMNNEYIVPMTDETKSITLFPDEKKKHGLPGIGLSTSLRPRMHFSSPSFVCESGPAYRNNGNNGSGSGDCFQYSPEFPLDILKIKTIEMLTEAVREGSMHVRDPIGGSTEFLFVPLIKLFYTMLIMGVFQNGDLKNILRLIEPSVFCEEREGQENAQLEVVKESETEGRGEDGGRNMPKEGLLQMKLPEPVKLQVTFTKPPQFVHSLQCQISVLFQILFNITTRRSLQLFFSYRKKQI